MGFLDWLTGGKKEEPKAAVMPSAEELKRRRQQQAQTSIKPTEKKKPSWSERLKTLNPAYPIGAMGKKLGDADDPTTSTTVAPGDVEASGDGS